MRLEQIATCHQHEGVVQAVAWAPDGERFVSAGYDGTVFVWNALTWTSETHFTPGHGPVMDIAYAPDGSRIAYANFDGTVSLRGMGKGAETKQFLAHQAPALCVRFSPDGKRLATGGRDNLLKIWDLQTYEEITTFRGHSNWVESIDFDAAGKNVASCDWDGQVKVWDLADRKAVGEFPGDGQAAMTVALVNGAEGIVVGGQDHRLEKLSLAHAHPPLSFAGHRSTVREVIVWPPDSRQLLSASQDGTVRVWDLDSAWPVFTTPKIGTWLTCMAAARPAACRLVIGGLNGAVYGWQIIPS